jgi:hypothetical protein
MSSLETAAASAAGSARAAGRERKRSTRAGADASAGSAGREWERLAAGADATARPAATRKRLATRAAGLAATAGRLRRLVDEQERPLVVMAPPLIKPDRLVLALADDAHHPAGHAAAAERARHRRGARRAGTDAARPRPGRSRRSGLAALGARHEGILSGQRRAGANRNELVVGDRVFVFLPEVMSLDQDVDARRQRLVLGLEQANRADVLLSAEHELFFLLPLGVVAPHRERDGHQDRHDRQGHEQRGHRVTICSAKAGSRRRRTLTP